MNCAGCRFWNWRYSFDRPGFELDDYHRDPHSYWEQCRRHSPVGMEDITPIWPRTNGDDFCGDFEPTGALSSSTKNAP